MLFVNKSAHFAVCRAVWDQLTHITDRHAAARHGVTKQKSLGEPVSSKAHQSALIHYNSLQFTAIHSEYDKNISTNQLSLY